MNPNTGILSTIAKSVAHRLAERKERLSLGELKSRVQRLTAPDAQNRPPKSLRQICQASDYGIIAEIKFASPSKGLFTESQSLSAVDVATQYLECGAAALSILTEVDHFSGNISNLRNVRSRFPEACLLMKDFFIDEYQLFEARSIGADAVLLIVALLGEKACSELYGKARALGLDVLVEVHDENELRSAESMGAHLIGVNNRNLKTLEIDMGTSLRLASKFKSHATRVSESGLVGANEILKLKKAGYSAFLMGSTFMKTANPGAALKQLQLDLGQREDSH